MKKILITYLLIILVLINACHNKNDVNSNNIISNKENDVILDNQIVNNENNIDHNNKIEINEKTAVPDDIILECFFQLYDNSNKDEFIVLFSTLFLNNTIAVITLRNGSSKINDETFQVLRESYLVILDNDTQQFLNDPVYELGLRQIMYKIENNTFALYKIINLPYVGWEKYSLECIVYDGVNWIPVNISNVDNIFDYWENRKPVFEENKMISIYTRNIQKGSYEELLENTEVMGGENYDEYQYEWEFETNMDIDNIFSTDSIDIIQTVPFHKKSENEIIKLLYNNTETYFSSGFSGAGVMDMAVINDNTVFIVKKLGLTHGSGWQSLYIGIYNDVSQDFLQINEFPGDHSEAKIFYDDSDIYVFFNTVSVYQGFPSSCCGILKYEDGYLKMIWPVNYDINIYNAEKDDLLHNYWQGKKAALSENDILEIYRLDYKFHEDMGYGYDLILEKNISIYNLIY